MAGTVIASMWTFRSELIRGWHDQDYGSSGTSPCFRDDSAGRPRLERAFYFVAEHLHAKRRSRDRWRGRGRLWGGSVRSANAVRGANCLGERSRLHSVDVRVLRFGACGREGIAGSASRAPGNVRTGKQQAVCEKRGDSDRAKARGWRRHPALVAESGAPPCATAVKSPFTPPVLLEKQTTAQPVKGPSGRW
jgi:hypothetical protein